MHAIRRPHPDDLGAVKKLLEACNLPAADLTSAHLDNFLVVTHGAEVIATVGFEQHHDEGLLRSLAVAPTMRGSGWGERMVAAIEEVAQRKGVKTLFLLTTTASGFFVQLGYHLIDRASAPTSMQDTTQFAQLCPASSTCMSKTISE